MKTLSIVLSLIMICAGSANEPTIIISKRPDWQKEVMDKVDFGAEIKTIDELLGSKIKKPDQNKVRFIIFKCIAKEDLGMRLIGIKAEVEFSNGYKREFDTITFHFSKKGIEYDIVKIPFQVKNELSIKSIKITSVGMK